MEYSIPISPLGIPRTPAQEPRSHSVGPLPPTLILLTLWPHADSTQALGTQWRPSGCHSPMPTFPQRGYMHSCPLVGNIKNSWVWKIKTGALVLPPRPHLPFATVCSQQAKFLMQGLPVCDTLLAGTPLPVHSFPYAGLCGAIASCRRGSSLQESPGLGGNYK